MLAKRTTRAFLATALFVVACSDQPPPVPTAPPQSATADHRDAEGVDPAVVRAVRELVAQRGLIALPSPARVRPQLARLGQLLAFDPILSGNRNISCMTCHLPGFGTGDGRALSIGEGGEGTGPARTHPQGVFIPRNAPPLFNLSSMKQLFWDGRVELDASGALATPAGAHLTPDMRRVLEFGPLSALAMFPVTSRTEMRGQLSSGNELAAIPDEDFTALWQALMNRLGAIPEYRALFEAAYPGERFSDMTFAHASNAIGAFTVDQLTFADTPWDRFLAGNDGALTPRQLDGAQTFLSIRCSLCHNGATFSDNQFHNVAVPQIGPGQGDGVDGRDDFGRMRVSGNPDDRYRFRTTPLRNVELTAPYGHDGSIASLRGFIEHYSESHLKLLNFDPNTLEPALRTALVPNAAAILDQRDPILDGVVLPDEIVDRLMDYMGALTDDRARNLSATIPPRVPSKLPLVPPRGG